jgi:outer membrane protein assembly factor BamA
MQRPKLNQSVDSEVGADKRLARNDGPPLVDGRLQQLINEVTQHGYVVIPNAFSEAEVEEAKAELAHLSWAKSTSEKVEVGGNTSTKSGRNTFEGLKTERIYSLANKSRVFDKFALHPDVLALNDFFLDRGYLLNSFQSINIQPGEQPQTLHFDDGYITVPRPHRPFGAVRQHSKTIPHHQQS